MKQQQILLSVFLWCAAGFCAAQTNSFIATTQLSADNELHVVTGADSAEGSAQFVYDEVTDTLSWVIIYTGMTENPSNGHIHGPADSASTAGVILNLLTSSTSIPFGSPAAAAVLEGSAMMPRSTVLDAITDGLAYVNLHTSMNGAGEMRGQLAVRATQIYAAAMDSGQETGPLNGDTSLSIGEAAFEYDPALGVLSWDVRYSGLTSPVTVAHIHSPAGTGENAPPSVTLTDDAMAGFGSIRGATDAVDPAVLQALFSGRAYINVHTEMNTGGEIRGQIAPIPFEDGFETVSP